MPPLRIVHAIPFAWPATRFGGPVAQLARICPALAARGHEVRLVTTDLGIPEEVPRDTWVEHEGYRIWYGRTRGPLERVAPYWEPMLYQPLRNATLGADILHLHLGLTLLNAMGRKTARNLGVPYIYAPRGSLSPRRLQDRRLSKTLFVSLFERRVIRDAAALHALTPVEVDDLTRLGAAPDRIYIVPNSVDAVALTPEDTVEARHRFSLTHQDHVVLFLSQLHPIKGLDILLETLARLLPRHPTLKLLIAGPDTGGKTGSLALAARLGVSGACRFVGHLDGREKLLAFAAADIFSLPSYAEGLPNAVLEACAAGLPVLISTQCNLPDIAESGAGHVAPAEVDAFTNALERMITQRDLCRQMGVRGRALVEQRFSVLRVVERLEAMYCEVSTKNSLGPPARTRAFTEHSADA